MNYDKKLINGLLFDDQDAPLDDRIRLLHAIGYSFAPLNKPVIDYVLKHYDTYGRLPKRDTMESSFPAFDFSANSEPYRFYIKEAYEWKQTTRLLEDTEKVTLLLSEKKIQEALTEWLSSAKVLENIDFTSSDIKVTEYAETFRKEYLEKQKLGDAKGITTGYDQLNEITFGIQPSDFWLIAARPKSFKTFNLLNMCKSAVEDTDHKGSVLFFSKEMSKHQINQRLAAMIGQVNYKLFKRYKLCEEELDRISDGMKMLANEIIIIGKDVQQDYSPAFVKSKIMEYSPKLAFVDGIYLFAGTKWSDQTDMTREVREISLFTETPIVGTVQQNKSGNAVAYSDSYLQDASVLIFQDRGYDETLNRPTTAFKMHLKHSREDEEGETFFVTIDFNSMTFMEGTKPDATRDEFMTDAFANL